MPAITTRLHRTALLLVLALIGSVLIAGPAKADPTAAAPPVDISGTMPRASRGEVTYDFLGRGYDQRLVAEDGNLNLYNPPALGGGKVKSVSLDLAAPPQSVDTTRSALQMYDYYSNEGDWSCGGCLAQRAEAHGYNAIYLVVLDGSLYVSGTKNTTYGEPGYPDYANLIYKAPLDLSCASSSCLPAANVKAMPNFFQGNQGGRIVGTTSLAGGFSGGNPYLAVGLTDYGVQIFDADLNYVSSFGGMATQETAQTPVIALAWDAAPSGRLVVGVMSYGAEGFLVDVDGTGAVRDSRLWAFNGDDQLYAAPMSVTFGHRADGSLLAVFGTSGGVDAGHPASLYLVDGVNGGNTITSLPVPGNGVVSVQSVPRIDGSAGGDDFAVFSDSGFGSLLRYDQASNALSFLPLQQPAEPGGTTTQLATDAFRSWFPGYKTGRFVIENAAEEDVDVRLEVRSDAGYGCWYAPAFAGSTTFPTDTVRVPAQSTSDVYTMGGLTAGPQGLCGADDNSSSWRGYLVVTPVGRPADARIVNVQLIRDDLTVDVTDQAGGSTTVAATQGTGNPGAFGLWIVGIDGPAAPTQAFAPPAISAARQITTNVRGRPSVYRVDVGSTSWTVPGATAAQPQVQAVLPPLQVQASLDGQTWVGVGKLMPIGLVNRSGTTVTMSGATFWWENPAGAPAYKQLRVLNGSFPSAPVVLASLPSPTAPAAPLIGLQLTATKTNSNVANVVPSGLDQGQVLVQITDQNGVVPANAAAYDSVYYRDPDNNLVTNLYDTSGEYLGVQPGPGAYPNVGAALRRGRPVAGGLAYDYVTTTSLERTTVTGWIGVGPPTAANSARLVVNDQAVNIELGGGTGSTGFSLEGCTDFSSGSSCVMAPATPTRPALYQAGTDADFPLVGVQLINQGQNSPAGLPLQWQPGQTPQLANSGITLSNQSALATLTNANGFSANALVDITLVSHGRSVPVTLPVFN